MAPKKPGKPKLTFSLLVEFQKLVIGDVERLPIDLDELATLRELSRELAIASGAQFVRTIRKKIREGEQITPAQRTKFLGLLAGAPNKVLERLGVDRKKMLNELKRAPKPPDPELIPRLQARLAELRELKPCEKLIFCSVPRRSIMNAVRHGRITLAELGTTKAELNRLTRQSRINFYVAELASLRNPSELVAKWNEAGVQSFRNQVLLDIKKREATWKELSLTRARLDIFCRDAKTTLREKRRHRP